MSVFTLTIGHVKYAFPPKASSEHSAEEPVRSRFQRAVEWAKTRPLATGAAIVLAPIAAAGVVAVPFVIPLSALTALATVSGVGKITQAGWVGLAAYQSIDRFAHPQKHRQTRAGGIAMFATAAGLEEQCFIDDFTGQRVNEGDALAAKVFEISGTRSILLSFIPEKHKHVRRIIGHAAVGSAVFVTLGKQYLKGEFTLSDFFQNPTMAFPALAVFLGTKGDTTPSYVRRLLYNYGIPPLQITFLAVNHFHLAFLTLGKNGPELAVGTLQQPVFNGIPWIERQRERVRPDYIDPSKPFDNKWLGDDEDTHIFFRIKNPEKPVDPTKFSVVTIGANNGAAEVQVMQYERKGKDLQKKGSKILTIRLPEYDASSELSPDAAQKWAKGSWRQLHDARFDIHGNWSSGVIVLPSDAAITQDPKLVARLRIVANNLGLPPEAIERAGLGNVSHTPKAPREGAKPPRDYWSIKRINLNNHVTAHTFHGGTQRPSHKKVANDHKASKKPNGSNGPAETSNGTTHLYQRTTPRPVKVNGDESNVHQPRKNRTRRLFRSPARTAAL